MDNANSSALKFSVYGSAPLKKTAKSFYPNKEVHVDLNSIEARNIIKWINNDSELSKKFIAYSESSVIEFIDDAVQSNIPTSLSKNNFDFVRSALLNYKKKLSLDLNVLNYFKRNYYADRADFLNGKLSTADLSGKFINSIYDATEEEIIASIKQYSSISQQVSTACGNFDEQKMTILISEFPLRNEIFDELSVNCLNYLQDDSNTLLAKFILREYIEFKRVFKCFWIYFNEDRDKLKILLDEKSYRINLSKSANKKGSVANKSGITKRFDDLLNELLKTFQDIDKDVLKAVIQEIQKNPPKDLPSPIMEILSQKTVDGFFKYFEALTCVLNFFTAQELTILKEVCKTTKLLVEFFFSKILFDLPFQKSSIQTNLDYWYSVVKFFTNDICYLTPINRLMYKPTVIALKNCRSSLFPISPDQLNSNICVTLDNLPSHYIAYSDFFRPMRHACSPLKELKGLRKHVSEEITLSSFIREFYSRATPNNDEILWNRECHNYETKFVCLLFLQYLRSLQNIIAQNRGTVSYRKTELLVNATTSLSHRIWLQITCKWGQVGPIPPNTRHHESVEFPWTLYLTIADHFQFDS